jgi:hypothetical protein
MKMKVVVSVVALVGIVVLAGAMVSARQRVVTTLAPAVGDLATARTVELVQDARVLLSGTFATTSEEDDEVERTASLTSSGSAKGVAEIEIERDGSSIKEEIELEARGLPADTNFVVRVDGQSAGTFTTNGRGTTALKLTRNK